MYPEAIELSEKALQQDSTNQYFLWLAGYAYAKTGRRREALATLERFNALAKTQYVEPYNVALIYVALADKDKAFAELEKALAERDWSMPFLQVDPFWEPLHDDPRFQNLLRRIGFPA